MKAAEFALTQASAREEAAFVLEGDSQGLMKPIKSKKVDRAIDLNVLDDMLDLWVDRAIDLNVLDDVLDFWNHGKVHDVSWVRRCGNGVAYCIAEWAVACS